MWLSTFHSLCARLLRREAPKIGLSRDFVIYDSSDQVAVVKQAQRELGIDDKLVPPRMALSRISQAKNRMEGPDVAARHLEPPRRADRQDLRAVPRRAQGRQRARLRRPAAEDGRAVRDVRADARASTRSKFRYVMVDEYQDTNRPQYLLIRRLAEVHRNLAVVGDPDQSIYKWRGADLRNILDFEHDFPEAKIVRLEQNYRSTQVILDAASAVISQNRNRKDKRLWTDRKGGSKIVYFRGNDELEEADFITRSIKQARSDDVDAMMAVLYRTNAQSRAIEDSLMRESDPLQDHRRRPLLRAQGDQGRARLPEADHQPARRRQPAAGDQRAGARHRQGRDGLAPGDRPGRRRRRRAAAAGRRAAGGQLGALALGASWSTPSTRASSAAARVTSLRDVPRPHRRPGRRRAAGHGVDRASARCSIRPATSRTCATRTAKRRTSASRT